MYRREKKRNVLTVAPALHPVRIDSCCVIFFSPDSSRYVLPQKSLAALVHRALDAVGAWV